MIEAKDIRKSFEGTPVLKGISASFDPGKTNLIIGQSGPAKYITTAVHTALWTRPRGTVCATR